MKIRNAVIAAGVSALLASGGFAWAAYTGQLNIIQWAGTVLGAPSNYGTSPGAVEVQGVNAFVTNTNANGSAVSASSAPVVIASDQVAVAVKAASGTIASGAIASGAVASGAYASGALAAGAIADGGDTTLGAKADAKSASTDTTPITAMQVLKEISAVEQAPVTRAVTNAGTFATQSAITAASGSIASGAIASGAVASGAYASGSIADGAEVTIGAKADAKAATTDATPITIMQVLKEISALEQAPAALPANQSTNVAQVNGHTTVEATTAGVQKVGIVGNAGAAVDAATGAAPPANIIYSGANESGATGGHVAGLINCDSHVFKHITSATDTLAVQGVASQIVYICGWRSRAAGVATWFLENTASANANCSSANTQINGVATEAANTGEVLLSNYWQGLKNTVGNGLCINSTGTGGVDVDVWYAQF